MLAYRSFKGLIQSMHSIHLAMILATTLLFIGTLGYMLIEDWSMADAAYMTVITLSTVGFSEVHPLSHLGRSFTAALILGGVGVAAYSITSIARGIIEGELKRLRGIKVMEKALSKMKSHSIVCGYGRLARVVVRELIAAGEKVVVVEMSPERVAELENSKIPYVEGSAYEDETLKAAGVERARSLLSLLPLNADNVYVTLCARDLNPSLHIIARAEDDSGEHRLKRAGAHEVFAPYRLSGHRIVQRILRPHVSNFLELAVNSSQAQLSLEEVVVPPSAALAGKSLGASGLRDRTGVIVAAVIEPTGEMRFNPDRETKLLPHSTMIVFGDDAALEKLTALLAE